MALKVLIIGGVACGPKTASRLGRLLADADVTMIDKGNVISYGACGLPYYVEGMFNRVQMLYETPAGIPRNASFFNKVKGVNVLTRTEALQIDRKNKTVDVKNLDSGASQTLKYDKLVLATGGSSFRPPINGIDLKNVWFMTHPDHAEGVVKIISESNLKRAVLVGAGFINIEMAEALVKKGLQVTVVEMLDQIMPGVLDKDIADLAALHLKEKGVKLIFGEKVTSLGGVGKVESVETDKQSIPADIVVVAVGTRPNDKLAREAGLDCHPKGGILINSYCQTSDYDIYAGGDCVLNSSVLKCVAGPMYVPLGSTANKHGRVIANHIAGIAVPFSGITGSSIIKMFDFTVGRTGISEKQAKELKLDIETVIWVGTDLPHFMPDSKSFTIKMIANKRDRKVLGLQVVGAGYSSKRLDVAATAIFFGATVDQVADIDFGYAPPFSPPLDPLAVCAHLMANKLDGIGKSISSYEAKKLIDSGDAVPLDVRSPAELKMLRMPYDVINIPLGALRERLNELPKDKMILAFCKICLRGYEAQRILSLAGFDKARFIEGGLAAWPFDLVKN